jgi:hypothetical protein
VTAYGRTAAEVAAVRRLRRALGEDPGHPCSSWDQGSEIGPAGAVRSAPPSATPDHRPSIQATEVPGHASRHGTLVVVGMVVVINGAAAVLSSRRMIDARSLLVLGALTVLAAALALTRRWGVAGAACPVDELVPRRELDPAGSGTRETQFVGITTLSASGDRWVRRAGKALWPFREARRGGDPAGREGRSSP